MIELLERWADLQPEFCRHGEDERFKSRKLLLVGQGHWQYIDLFELLPADYALIQFVLMQAIADWGARLRLENSSRGWHATIAKPSASGNLELLLFSEAADPALALLKNWVDFLSKSGEFERAAEAGAQGALAESKS